MSTRFDECDDGDTYLDRTLRRADLELKIEVWASEITWKLGEKISGPPPLHSCVYQIESETGSGVDVSMERSTSRNVTLDNTQRFGCLSTNICKHTSAGKPTHSRLTGLPLVEESF
jgi:hypothetical protein